MSSSRKLLRKIFRKWLIIDLDLKGFGYSKDKLDGALNKALKRMKDILGGYPTVLWTGNGYHIYQPLEGFVLEEVDIIAEFVAPNGKDLTSKFMEFAEDFLTNKGGDPQHNPTVNSCLVRIPGTINSKCNEEVKVIQKWDGNKPPKNYLLRDFRRWLINEKIEQQKLSSKERGRRKSVGAGTSHNNTAIPWIEKLLQTPVDDYRKFAIWRILAPYQCRRSIIYRLVTTKLCTFCMNRLPGNVLATLVKSPIRGYGTSPLLI